MKILVAQFKQETDSFSNVKCGLSRFKKYYYAYGDDLYKELEFRNTEMGGALSVLKKEGVNIIPSLAMNSCSGGVVKEDAYNHFKDIFFKDIERSQPVDGIYLCLHGATVFENDEDGMGRLIEEVREKAGREVIISVSFDFHANITKRMVENSDIIRGFQYWPHIDFYETGRDAAKLLVRTIKGEITPKMVAFKIPMINQAEGSTTTMGAMAELFKMAREAEKTDEILSVSYFQMQPWLDVYDAGCAVIVIGNNNTEMAKKYGEKFSSFLWDKKETFKVKLAEFKDILELAEKTDDVIVFSDSADAPSAGATGDSTVVLKDYIDRDVNYKTYMTVVDPETVKEAIELGVGKSKEFTIGGKIYTDVFSPVKLTGVVKLISDGTFEMYGDFSKGETFNVGKLVVIQWKNLYILVMENPTPVSNPGLYLSVGLDPAKAKLVMVKSPNQYKSTFNKYTDKLININTPGASASYIWELPFKNLKRPIYPFDNIEVFNPKVLATGFRGKKR